MTDPSVATTVPLAAAPGHAVEPWQARLEALGALLVVVAAVGVVSALVIAHEQSGRFGSGAGTTDWIWVGQQAGQQVGLLGAGTVLVALLLVTLGPGRSISRMGVATLQAVVVVGLVVAGLVGFAAVSLAANLPDKARAANMMGSALGLGARLGLASVLAAGAVLAGYVAWCAFSTLGEARDVGDEPEPAGTWNPDVGGQGDGPQIPLGGWGPPPQA
ncbi:hypothetical protein [Aquihabitans sp. McL0605]|uniref:hypothetical protein n=1 Tax=Aquihabitans sp. McL0605 TaxID=3415671 RepID=UPI003CE958F8